MEELKVGDRVKIVDDSPLARRIFKTEMNIGSISPYRLSLFGGEGFVDTIFWNPGKSIWPIARVYGQDGRINWPSVLLEKLPAEECKNIHHVSGVAARAAFREATEHLSHCPPAKCRCNIQIGSDPSPSNSGGAEIVFDHVVKDGKCMLQIADIRGVQGQGLPDEYLDGYDCRMVPSNQSGYIFVNGKKYGVGQAMTEEEAAKLVKRMRACGKRLHDINVASRAKADEERLERWKAKGQKVVRI